MPIDNSQRKKKLASRLLLIIVLMGLGVLIGFQVKSARQAVRLSACKQNIFFLGFVFRPYHEAEGRLPPAMVTDANGKPLYSWRVLLTPYCDRQEFFKRYNLEAPWDDPDNRKFAQDENFAYLFGCPAHPEYQDPRDDDFDGNRSRFTNYVAVVGPSTAFPETGEAVSYEDITDGLENTILLVEIADSNIHWSEPRDLRWDEMSFRINDPAKPSISSHHPKGPGVVFADGRVKRLSDSMTPDTLKALLTINGGENISRRDLENRGIFN